jgi:DNA-nicking Smr family endonuclease|tara:strand:+ start:430 stop:849 length:420 start_codon:yes stop_codon:yes gene_type:complete
VKKKSELSNTDKALWEEYLKNPKDIFDKELKTKNSDTISHRFRFDLHGYTLLDANQKIRELIINCQEKGFKEILLITGKGLHSNTDQDTYVSKKLSKLKFSIPEYINSNSELSDKIYSIEQASLIDGGEGAIIIKLKKL